MLINVDGEKERIPRSGQVERRLDSNKREREREREGRLKGSKARSRLPRWRLCFWASVCHGSHDRWRKRQPPRCSTRFSSSSLPSLYTVSSLYTARTPCATDSNFSSFQLANSLQTANRILHAARCRSCISLSLSLFLCSRSSYSTIWELDKRDKKDFNF